MRYALTLGMLTALATGACASESVARPAPPPVNWQSLEPHAALADAGKLAATLEERSASVAYLKALASPGFAELGRLVDDDVHFAFAGFRDVHGRENAIKAHDSLLGGVASRTVVATRVLLTDKSQVVEWTMTGTYTATHKPVTLNGLTLLWTKDDGSFSDIHLYFDEALLKAQTGAGPKPLLALPAPPMPSGPPLQVEQARSLAEAANVSVVRASLEALENKDEPAYLATMNEDVEVTTPESAKPARGKADARAYLKSMHKAIAQLDTGIDNVWGIGSFVVVEYHTVGEQRGPLGFIPAQKDNLLKMFTVDVAELQGGKIAHVWRYDNPSQILLLP